MPTPSAAPQAVPTRGGGDACPGAVRLHQADDGWLARVRVPGGRMTVDQARALGSLALELGDGQLDLTSRGNLQLRGLAEDAGSELAARLDAAGLLPSLAHDRARNIVASPLSGLDGRGHLDVSSWVHEVDEILCSRTDLTQLSGRFLIGLDDGRRDVFSLDADVTVIATEEGAARLRLSDVDTAVTVPAADAARLAVAAAVAFLAAREDLGSDVWRVAELPDAARLVIQHLGRRSGVSVDESACASRESEAILPGLGLVGGPFGRISISVLSRLGRVTREQWGAVVAVAAGAAGELRVTPWRGVVVPAVPPTEAGDLLSALGAAGFVTDAASPWAGATACAGRPGCARSLTDVRGDATAALTATAVRHSDLPVHWSGCGRRCGHPRDAHIEVVGTESGYRAGLFGGETKPVPIELIAGFLSSARRTP